MKDSLRAGGWGYYPVDPKFKGDDFRKDVRPMFYKDTFDYAKSYVLVGVEPDRMFKPDKTPEQLDFFHWDNSMQPWLRHISPANSTGHKLWSRLTYRKFCMDPKSPALESHRQRINRRLQQDSNGAVRDIAELWGGTRPTELPTRKRALVCASSQRNHREFFNEDQAHWIHRVTNQLQKQGYEVILRHKVGINQRKTNETTDQIRRDNCDLVVANYSACASEAVVTGVPVVTTTDQNPARSVSTPWEDFCQGIIHKYTVEDIEHWVTRICAYTYHREELNSLSWIDVHPEAGHLREKRNESR